MPTPLESRMAAVLDRIDQLAERLADPAVLADPGRVATLNKEWAELAPLADTYRAFLAARDDLAAAEELLAAGKNDPDTAALAAEEKAVAARRLADCEAELHRLLTPRDPNDDKNVILEIRAGTGGEEAALFAAVLARMYTMYCEKRGFTVTPVSENGTELGGFKEICLNIEGRGAYSRFRYESGVHRVQRVPETESAGRIHTSAVTVAVMPEVEEVALEIRPADLKIDTYRSSGAGGQHINKTDSAIRITHLPTGMVVECQDERSQYKNKDKAMRVLRARLYDRMKQEQADAVASDRKAQVGSGDRSERIRTYNYPQGRVTDHRGGLTLYRLDAILNGDLDELLDPLIESFHAERMAQEE